MILDLIRNADRYRPISRRIASALDFLAQPSTSMLAIGRHCIDGENIIAIVDDYIPRAPANSFWESHRRYIDVQQRRFRRRNHGLGAAVEHAGEKAIRRLARPVRALRPSATERLLAPCSRRHVRNLHAG